VETSLGLSCRALQPVLLDVQLLVSTNPSILTDNSKLCESKGHRVMGLQLEGQSRNDGKVKKSQDCHTTRTTQNW
jgi:hypothetical protein